jgi:hypothetical protein
MILHGHGLHLILADLRRGDRLSTDFIDIFSIAAGT